MDDKKMYDTVDCMKLIKKKYPFIPKWIIQRVLFGEKLYMKKVGLIDCIPSLDHWKWN